ncbi:alpha/beta fold hydrolase [Gordonia sp. CPCC 205333]|uniref:alpha/beta hydrolase family protein n=1 Tax=Gordonia sp. CPCC 205333 TaxID=3140790 RepID=UPI003AF379B7
MAELEDIVEDGVAATVHRPDTDATATVILAHGAGGNRDAAILRAYADEFTSRGVAAVRIDLPYRLRRPKGPPSPSTSPADRAGIAAACERFRDLSDGPLVIGGHSYGGRQASMLIAEDASLAAGLFLSSYPLHPPGKPDRLRTEHLPSITVPTLVIHGSSDPFAAPDELRAAMNLIDAQTDIVTVKAPHSLNPARTDVARLAVDAALNLLIDV